MLWWFAQTTLIAGALAVVASLAGRRERLGPEVRHALWLVVLIKFAIPPFVAWPWGLADAWPPRVEIVSAPAPVPVPVDLPAPSTVEIGEPTLVPSPIAVEPLPADPLADLDRPEVAEALPAPATPEVLPTAPESLGVREPGPSLEGGEKRPPSRMTWSSILDHGPSALLALWLAGSVVIVARRAIKVVRFRRALADSRPAPDWLVEEARAIGERVGVRPPRMVATSGVSTPLLWCLGRPRLILPDALIKRLGADRWPGILAHELAHLARRDHWVVRLELLVEAVWWWNPLFRLARNRLHEEAEHACDARVVRSLPERRFAYAEALVDVCEHLARSAIPSPSLGVGGAGASRSLEGRLHMILQDSIPRRPSRRGALAATLLAALALPAWTLGQQPDPPKPESSPKAEAAPGQEPSPKSEPSKPGPAAETLPPGHQFIKPFVPPIADLTIDDIRAGFEKRRQSLNGLAMRYVVAGRDRSTRADGRGQAVRVQVADVVLDLGAGSVSNYRVDVLSEPDNPEPRGPAGPTPDGRAVPWVRHFVAREVAEIVTFQGNFTLAGPVPFRRQRAGEHLGDDLSATLSNPIGLDAVSPDRAVDPLEPRPANVLDLDGAPALLLGPVGNPLGRLEVAGVGVVEGREIVRIAWVGARDDGQGGGRLRGLLWVAPSLGFAVVRSEATQDPSQAGMTHGRRTWRKTSADFVEVGGLWLPRKVEIRTTEANAPDGSTLVEHERVATIEDYRANPDLTPETFHPKFKIEALDEQAGNFTISPPKPAPGLVERLARAVRESPFGPPIVERVDEAPKALVVSQPAKVVEAPVGDSKLPIPPGTPGMRNYADIVTNVDEAPAGRLTFGVGPEIERQFKADPGLTQAEAKVAAAKAKLESAKRIAGKPGDPAEAAARKKLDSVTAQYEQLREEKLKKLLNDDLPQARANIDLLQARREGKAAEVQKAEAHRKLARSVVQRNERLVKQGKGFVTQEEAVKAEAEVEVAEAEVAVKQAELKEADVVLDLARRSLGDDKGANPGPKAESPGARDEVGLVQARRDGKAAELQKVEARRDKAQADLRRASALLKRSAIGQEEFDQITSDVKVAEADVALKKADLDEADILLNQAKQRPGATRTSARGSSTTAAQQGLTLPELRDAVEIMEVQLQGKQAEMRGAESKLQFAKLHSTATRNLAAKAGVSETEVVLAEARVRTADSELDAKKADVLEFEVRIKHAKRRAEAEEARLKREVVRVKARLDWSEDMRKKGFVSKATHDADKAAYDDLMIQLDPKYVPAAPSPDDQSRKDTPAAKLAVKLDGEKARITGQAIAYKVSVNNPGATPAHKVEVVAALPREGGKLLALPPGAKFNTANRKLTWTLPSLEPRQVVDVSFAYATSTPGVYTTTVEAITGESRAGDSMKTDVAGIGVLDVQVSQTDRVMDVGKSNNYDITIKNSGTKEATGLRLGGKLTGNLKVLKHFNAEKGDFQFDPESGRFDFPRVERLGVGQSFTLGLEVQATESGPAGCHVYLAHDGMGEGGQVEDVISTTVAVAPREPAAK